MGRLRLVVTAGFVSTCFLGAAVPGTGFAAPFGSAVSTGSLPALKTQEALAETDAAVYRSIVDAKLADSTNPWVVINEARTLTDSYLAEIMPQRRDPGVPQALLAALKRRNVNASPIPRSQEAELARVISCI